MSNLNPEYKKLAISKANDWAKKQENKPNIRAWKKKFKQEYNGLKNGITEEQKKKLIEDAKLATKKWIDENNGKGSELTDEDIDDYYIYKYNELKNKNKDKNPNYEIENRTNLQLNNWIEEQKANNKILNNEEINNQYNIFYDQIRKEYKNELNNFKIKKITETPRTLADKEDKKKIDNFVNQKHKTSSEYWQKNKIWIIILIIIILIIVITPTVLYFTVYKKNHSDSFVNKPFLNRPLYSK